jgi:hypothetical protein
LDHISKGGEKLYDVFPSNLLKKAVCHKYVRLSPISTDEQNSPLESKAPPIKLPVNIVNEYPPRKQIRYKHMDFKCSSDEQQCNQLRCLKVIQNLRHIRSSLPVQESSLTVLWARSTQLRVIRSRALQLQTCQHPSLS